MNLDRVAPGWLGLTALSFAAGLAALSGCGTADTSGDDLAEAAGEEANADTPETDLVLLAGGTARFDLVELNDQGEVPLSDADTPETDLLVEKIRRGTVVDYDDQIANSIVVIAAGSPAELCTAQVVNRNLLITAAHCASHMFPNNGSGQLVVGFTDRAGGLVIAFNGTATGVSIPNWRFDDRDIAVIKIASGLTTCQSGLSACASQQPDVPVNAAFQYFTPGFALLTAQTYPIVGYGTTDNNVGGAVPRRGTLKFGSAKFTDNNNGFKFTMNWTSDTDTRPCEGDSGSPLVVPLSGATRSFFTGIASATPTTCTASSGSVTYAGYSSSQIDWILGQFTSFKKAQNLPFDCVRTATPTAPSLQFFACDNDGTLF